MSDSLIFWVIGGYVVQGLIWGGYCFALANVKKHNTMDHFWGGFFFGIVNMLYLIAIPPKTTASNKMEANQPEKRTMKEIMQGIVIEEDPDA